MQAPGNYDDTSMTIRVDPDSMYRLATVDMANHAQTISDAIHGIVQTWNGLKLGWAGTTASEVQDFNSKWTQAVSWLFGTKSHPKSGALPKIADGVDLASINYGVAEDTVVKNFFNLSNSVDIGALAGLSQPQPGSPARNQGQGPVTEQTF